MTEPNLIAVDAGLNAGVSALVTLLLGPLLGQYAIIVGAGLMGTLVGLSENNQSSLKASAIFLLRGLAFSCVFSSVATSAVIKLSPVELGVTPYAIMGCVAFCIGWSSDRLSLIKTILINKLTSRITGDKS
jgi:hypothetical protein